MINNNPYNIPEKKTLSQSKIFPDNSSSRHSSTYMQNRPSNDVMYNSSIFMKNSSIMNLQSQPTFFQPIRQPLSPHSKYPKQPQNIQYIPPYNHIPIRQPQNNYFPVNPPKDVNTQRILAQLREKLQNVERRLEAQEKKNFFLNETQTKKEQNIPQTQSLRLIVEDSLNNNDKLKDMVSSMVQQSAEQENKKIWQKLKDLDQSVTYSSTHLSSQKLSRLEESFFRSQSQKLHDEQLMNRIKTIEKTIRQMGEDIHLVNDKQESLSAKIQNQLPWLRSELKSLKTNEKKTQQIEKRNQQLKEEIQRIMKKMKLLESVTESNLTNKIKQLQTKINTVNNSQRNVKSSFEKYFQEPIILKYLQKFQVSNTLYQKNTFSNSTKCDSSEQISINQITYFIDQEGYLLDNDRYYLVNGSKNQKIRLDPKHVQKLKERRILI